MEAEASTWKLADLLQSGPRYKDSLIKGKSLDFKSLFKFTSEGGEFSKVVRYHCLEVWSAGVINQIYAYDPELIILGGGIMKSVEIIVPFIREKVRRHA